MVRRCFGLIGLLILGFSTNAWARLTAELDRIPVTAGDSFTLTLSIDKNTRSEPDISVLSQLFSVVGTSQVMESSSVNGKMSIRNQRQITLVAEQPGTYHIPALQWDGETADPVEVRVVPRSEKPTPDPTETLFMRADVDQKQALVQSEVVLTVRVYYAMQIYNRAEFKPLVIDNALVESLGKESQYQTRMNGRTYGVIEKRYAIFPQKPGTLRIPSIAFDTEVASRQSNGFPLDIFNRTSEEHLQSDPLTIEVSAPPSGATQPWLPARKLSLSAELTPESGHYRAGDPLTWTLTLQADGLSEAQLPPLSPAQPAGAKVYPDAPQLSHAVAGDRLIGKRVEKIAVIPTQAGEIHLPEIRIPWWNTLTRSAEIAVIPARTLQIEADPATSHNTAIPETPAQAENKSTPPTPPVVRIPEAPFWKPLAIAAAAAWLLTIAILLVVLRRRPHSSALPRTNEEDDAGARFKAIIAAAERDNARQTRQALLAWLRRQGYASIGDWLKQEPGGELREAVAALDRACYGEESVTWRGNMLVSALNNLARPRREKSREPALPALYPE